MAVQRVGPVGSTQRRNDSMFKKCDVSCVLLSLRVSVPLVTVGAMTRVTRARAFSQMDVRDVLVLLPALHQLMWPALAAAMLVPRAQGASRELRLTAVAVTSCSVVMPATAANRSVKFCVASARRAAALLRPRPTSLNV